VDYVTIMILIFSKAAPVSMSVLRLSLFYDVYRSSFVVQVEGEEEIVVEIVTNNQPYQHYHWR
jgi:hypothetical protein